MQNAKLKMRNRVWRSDLLIGSRDVFGNKVGITRAEVGPPNTSGFSLLETIVAISILMITIVGPLSLAAKGIVFADYVKDEITGFYLAQEAVEAIRNIRDTNIKNNVDWLRTIKENCMSADGNFPEPCRIDIWQFNDLKSNGDLTDHGLQKCTATGASDQAECERVNVVDVGEVGADSVTGAQDKVRLYGYDFSPGILGSHQDDKKPSIFSRKITVKNITKDYTAMPVEKIPSNERSLLTLDPSGIDEINVTVEVTWSRSGNARSVKVSENLFSI